MDPWAQLRVSQQQKEFEQAGMTIRICLVAFLQLNPDIVRDKWNNEEDALLVRLVGEMGHHWASIARCVDGRTDQQCMGRWRRHLDPTIKKVRVIVMHGTWVHVDPPS